MHRAYRQSTRLFAAAILGLGLAMIVTTLARGGGALARRRGVVLGQGRAFALGQRRGLPNITVQFRAVVLNGSVAV